MSKIEITTSAHCVARVRAALDRWRGATIEWVSATWELAEALHEARHAHPSNKAFSVWLAENDIECSPDDRAALIYLAGHGDTARDVLNGEETRISLRALRGKVEERLHLRSPAKTDAAATPEPETPESAAPQAHSDEGDSAIVEESPPPKISNASKSRSALLKRDDGERIWNHHTSKESRKTLNALARSKARTQLGALILVDECIQNGAFGGPSNAAVTKPTLRLALPWAPIDYANRFDLTRAKDREEIRAKILPVVLDNLDRLRARPTDLPLLMAQRREAAIAEHKQQYALAKLANDEQEIIAYGRRLWPLSGDEQLYTYDNARNAVWFFDFLVNQFPKDWSAGDKANQTRHLIGWIKPELRNGAGFAIAVEHITHAYQQNGPDAERRYPIRPVNLGKG